jgi:hypothetical protein
MWAQRFAGAFATLADLQACFLEHAWQPVDAWPPANRAMLEAKGRVGPHGRVVMHASPEQFVVVVCGGMGNLQAVALPTWGDTTMQSARAIAA